MTPSEEAALKLLRDDPACASDPLVGAYLSYARNAGAPLVEMLAHCVRELAASRNEAWERLTEAAQRRADVRKAVLGESAVRIEPLSPSPGKTDYPGSIASIEAAAGKVRGSGWLVFPAGVTVSSLPPRPEPLPEPDAVVRAP